MKSTPTAAAILLVLSAAGAWSAAAGEESRARFNRDIRPLLSANCFQCHGPDAEHREADLRLDEEAGVRAAFGGGLAGSAAWQRITSDDPEMRMPPPESHRELKAEELAALRAWVERGAAWEGHWAFLPARSPELPSVGNPRFIRNPIDAFIQARLDAEGLAPSGEADKERLLRRVTLDLTGLPPTIQEIDDFLADDGPAAYEKAVDRLLASEHYGERMAVAWMDAARYGDSSVFHADGPRDMWPWRDWVIRAYNDNMPFDQFTVEQIAGDLLPEATLAQKIATGFNRNNASTDEGGAIAEEFRVEYAVDRVKTTSMVWLGLTMECGQCHDHKYDPISQQDYYRFYAYFNQAADPGMQTRKGNQTPVVSVIDEASQQKAELLKTQLPTLESQLAGRGEAVAAEFLQWAAEEAQQAEGAPRLPGGLAVHVPLDELAGAEVALTVADEAKRGTVAGTPNWVAGNGNRAFKCDGGNYIDAGDVANFERTDSFSYGAWIKPEGGGNGAAIARMDDRGGHRGYDLFVTGNKVAVHIINSWPTNAVKVNTTAALKPNQWQHVFVTYDGSSKAAGVKVYFDGQEQKWAIEQDRLSASIRTAKPLHIGRRNPGAPFKGEVDDVRVYARRLSAAEVQALAGHDTIGPLLAKGAAAWSDSERAALLSHYLSNHDETGRQLRAQIAGIKAEIAAAEKPVSTVMVMQDVASPRMTYMLDRGNYASPKKDRPVEPGVPAVFPAPPEGAPANRLGLAQWLVQKGHPLTARVAVNRYWQMFFGVGLVKTVEDFGAQGEWPSHPELLDWLAVDFVEHGWDVKRTVKQIVMSHAYRQTSRIAPEALRRDPENRLLARGPRFRLQAEFVRDNALAASGLLVNRIGGPSVKPYQPPGLWFEVTISGERFVPDAGEKLFRRSMYTYWKRSAPAPMLTIFDTPTREKCVMQRSRTNTPLQALVTLNDPQFVEAARGLAERAMKEGGATIDERIAHAYRLATGLKPGASTVAVLKTAYEHELGVFQADTERANELLSVGAAPRDPSLDAAQHASLSVVCSLILNLDAAITRG